MKNHTLYRWWKKLIIPKTDLAYIAAWLDDGATSCIQFTPRAQVTICSSDDQVLFWIKSVFGGGQVRANPVNFVLKIYPSALRLMLPLILPYMRVRRELASSFLERLQTEGKKAL